MYVCVLCHVLQEHGSILPMLISSKTAQPAAAIPLSIMEEGLGQLERLAAANLKGGVFQGKWWRAGVTGGWECQCASVCLTGCQQHDDVSVFWAHCRMLMLN